MRTIQTVAGGSTDQLPPDQRPDLAGPNPAEVFARLFDEHARPLHRYLARRVGASTADDLVAETFLAAFEARDRYDPGRAVVRSWLYGIATNLLHRHQRQEMRALAATARAASAAGVGDEQTDGHETRVADRLDAQNAVKWLAGALAALSEGDRDVLLLTSWAGLDSAEVAQALDIPVGTVRSRLHRVRQRLKAEGPQSQRYTDDGNEGGHE